MLISPFHAAPGVKITEEPSDVFASALDEFNSIL